MLLKVMVLFFMFIIVMGMFGSRTLPGMKYLDLIRCGKCGKLRLSKSGCDCPKIDRKG